MAALAGAALAIAGVAWLRTRATPCPGADAALASDYSKPVRACRNR